LTDEKLANGEVFGDEVTTPRLNLTSRIYRWAWLAKRLVRVSSTVAMVARRGCAEALRLPPVTASPDQHGYTFSVT
jgi:hypothetical protein